MENKNNSKCNKILFVCVFVLFIGVACCLKLIYNIDRKISPTTVNDTTISNDENVVKNEINTLIKYLNGDYYSDHLSTNYEEMNFFQGKDIFDNIMVEMYECLHNIKLTSVDDNPWNGSSLLTKSQYEDFKKYFYKDLVVYDNNNVDLNSDYIVYDNIKDFLNGNYYYGYVNGDGFGADDIKYSISSINKVDNHFEVVIDATTKTLYDNGSFAQDNTDIKYQGTLKVEVVGNYLKYNPLIFKKVS